MTDIITVTANTLNHMVTIILKNDVSAEDVIRLVASAQSEEVHLSLGEGKVIHLPDQRYVSPAPIGYDTILGFLAKYDPDTLDGMDKTPEATQRDGWSLTSRCAKEGRKMIKVPAPEILREEGIEEVNAYPVDLLRKRFEI